MILHRGKEVFEIDVSQIRRIKTSRRNKRNVTKITLYDGRKLFADEDIEVVKQQMEEEQQVED